ncbi:hypothetical protein GWK08_01125 [Leptobacterium flavescens]|uniref:Putative zinc ribbon domain-containing protein n=1 Tax=Leptobacterium flavescens TaxID=472055 RepID=A0A6P0UHV7_9FLAO|nr:zinc ribbon domain-containing protein [Leptobacterium flavescens]NER12030.1 hypothetical protein [Leptobacterium flavescens]
MKTYKNCQSCGMPLKKDPKGGAYNSDGTLNEKYCSYCFEEGAFKQADWTLPQMQEFVKGKLREMGFPGFMAGFFTKRIANLERWKDQKIY